MKLGQLYGISASAAIALAVATLDFGADVAAAQPPQSVCGPAIRSTTDKGIGVGDPKIFDNRTLALMLDTLNDSLRTAQIVDTKSLAANLNLLQGFQQDCESSRLARKVQYTAASSRGSDDQE